MYFDTHAHLNFPAFVKDRDKLIKECLKKDFWMLNVGTNLFTSKKAIEIAQNYDEGVYASVGLHPINLNTGLTRMKIDESEADKEESLFESEFDYEEYRKISLDKKVVAVGEIGLDYYYKPKIEIKLKGFKLNQKLLFLQHIKLAKELNLPLIIHCRMAHQDLLNILHIQEGIYHEKFRGVIHCFTGNMSQLNDYIHLGFHIGFNGIIFKLNLKDVIKKTPLDKMVLETDCPFFPTSSKKTRNDPSDVIVVAEEIAKIKKIDLKELSEKTTENARKLFDLN